MAECLEREAAQMAECLEREAAQMKRDKAQMKRDKAIEKEGPQIKRDRAVEKEGPQMDREREIALHRRFLRHYKKNTLAVSFSFALTFMLATSMLVLIHTNHRIDNIEYQSIFTPSDCYIDKLSWKQILQLKSNPALRHVAVTSGYRQWKKNSQSVMLQRADGAYITMMAKVMSGRLPNEPDEVVAEKWALLNLGVEPSLGEKFMVEDEDGREKALKLVGILSDMRVNKKYGVLQLYTCMDISEDTLMDISEGTLKGSSKDASKDTLKEASKDTPEGTLKDTSKDTPEGTLKDTSEDASKDTLKDTSKDTPEGTLKEASEDTSKDTLKEASKDTPEGTLKEVSEDASKDTLKDTSKDTPEGTLKEASKDTPEGTLKEASKNTLKDTLGGDSDTFYTAYVQFKNQAGYDARAEEIIQELGIKKRQVHKNPARENYGELYCIDLQVISVILFVCLVVFYGIYRIVLATREKQYGILRAVGMQRGQLLRMVLLELSRIYCIGAPVGIAAGLMVSFLLITVSGDAGKAVYLYNESVRFAPVVPVWQIAACVAVMAALTGWVGYATGWKLLKKPIVETIAGVSMEQGGRLHFYGITPNGGKLQTLCSLSCNYILGNLKICAFAALTVCTGVTLFTGLMYRARTLRTYRADTKEMWYLNGEYEMSVLAFDSPRQGISRKSAEEILELPEISQIKTAAGMPVRVIDGDGVKRQDAYYEERNAAVKEYYGYELRGDDGTDQIYKSVLYGYNTAALRELKKYVTSGDFDPENIREDEVILAALSMDRTKEDDLPGWYKDGEKLMDYHAGDRVTMKYRTDFQTGSLEYEMLEDSDSEYAYKTYTIAAVVSFPYMYDCSHSIYPLLITGDRQMQEIVPDGCFQCVYIDTVAGEQEMGLAQREGLERKLIQIGSQNSTVSTRSLIDDIGQNEMFYRKQMAYLYGIAAVAFVLALLNMLNNLRYRMHARTQEICMLRAVGMSVAMARKILLFENMALGLASELLAYVLSHPILKYLYQISDMKAFGHAFRYDYPAFFGVSAGALAVCMALSVWVPRPWKTRQVIEAMGKAE